MQVDYLENERFPIGLLEQGSLDGIAALVKSFSQEPLFMSRSRID